MLHIQNFSACVTVGGKELKEHQVEYSNGRTEITCWIASEAGKNFTVKWKDSTRVRKTTTSGRLTLDGIKGGQKVINPGCRGNHDTAERSYISTGPKSIRPFMFSNIQLTDDDAFLDADFSRKVGTIKLQIWNAIKLDQECHLDQPPVERKVHEKAKKVTTHCVKFGDEIQRASRAIKKVSRIDKKPLVTFVFKYKSLELLQADGIIEYPVGKKRRAIVEPGASVKDEVIEIDDDDDDDTVGALQTRRRAVNAPGGNTTPASANRHKRIKTETYQSGPGEIIDLT